MNKKVFITIISLLYWISSLALQPAYFVLGEEQFRGIQIYDVIQDKESNYWFATSHGIYHFNHYQYKRIECRQAKGEAVFNFVINHKGVIFCHNLNNQIFEISNEQCTLFYELKKDEVRSDISLSIADDDHLVISARKVIVVSPNGKNIIRYDANQRYIGPPFITSIGSVQFHLSNSDSVLIYSKSAFVKQKLNPFNKSLKKDAVLKFFRLTNSWYALDLKNKDFYRYNPSEFSLELLPGNNLFERSQSIRLYETGKDLWVTGTLPGIAFIDKEVSLHNNQWLFENYFISDVYKDREGNYLLCTFDKGVLVIPDFTISGVINDFKDDQITSLYADPRFGLILGSSKGQLINYIHGKLNLLDEQGKRPIETLCSHPESNFILFDNGYIRAYDKQTGRIIDIISASLKAVQFVSANEIYIGTNRGIYKVTWSNNTHFVLQPIPNINFRVYAMAYDAQSKYLYASTANGLLCISPFGDSKMIQYNGADVFPNSLCTSGKVIVASTQNNGILIIENGKVTGVIHPIIKGKEEALKKIIVYRQTIVANSINGLFQFDMKGNLLRNLHSDFCFTSGRIMDFVIDGNKLWVSHWGGVQQIDLNYHSSDSTTPIIRFDKIKVNGQTIIKSQQGDFNSDQRKMQFIFSSPTLRNRNNILYHYKLIGYDADWNSSSYELNEVTYNALAPGNYTLQVRTENKGTFSEIASYSFQIAYPFYVRWWFILFVVVVFLLVVFGTYRWQLGVQRKKSEQLIELNTAKLTAIQSQMNPHFIFNSLNSIQDLVLKGDVENSYSYITIFSNLVRKTLSHSEKDFIEFEQEMKLLNIYLSLEKLRFKNDFCYEIITEELEDIMLPPLLIQPFIENALVHGLLHKEGKKNLSIIVVLEGDVLTCTIEDNGIGRRQAKIISERQKKEHESFSGKAIRKRFDILSNVFKGQFGYTYQDLYEKDTPVGTIVRLTIPVKRKF